VGVGVCPLGALVLSLQSVWMVRLQPSSCLVSKPPAALHLALVRRRQEVALYPM